MGSNGELQDLSTAEYLLLVSKRNDYTSQTKYDETVNSEKKYHEKRPDLDKNAFG